MIPQPKVQNSKPSTPPRFILTCFNYREIGHTRPKCRKFFIRSDKEDALFMLKY